MRGTLRAHITLWASAVFLVLVAVEGGLVLGAFERALERMADRDLLEELEELSSEVADASLAALLRGPPAQGWTDLVFEIRDQLEARTSLRYEIRREDDLLMAGRALPRSGPVEVRRSVGFRQEGSLRVAEVPLGPYRVQIARDLTPLLETYAAVRRQILALLFGISAVAVLGAYLIATRALSPVRRLSEEAKRLRSLSEGSLPRSGRGDEIDDLAAVLNGLLERVRAEVLRTRRFTADAAHELRTPLAAIRGHLELLLGRVDLSSQGVISGVLEEVDRLTRLVSQLLLLEKLEGSPDFRERRRLDLGRLVRDLVAHLSVLAEEQEIELGCEALPTPVLGDPEKLRQVFLNLLDNAFKHTPKGGRVWVEVRPEGPTARAVVADTGPGIPADQLERIFDRFSTDRSRATRGTGLGLPIARAIAQAHGGELRAFSDVGARLVLELPAAA